MKSFSKYKVVLSGHVLPEHDRQQVIHSLTELFNSNENVMSRLLMGKQTFLKKEYSKDEAANICKAIRKAGAECKLEEAVESEIGLVGDDQPLMDEPQVEAEKLVEFVESDDFSAAGDHPGQGQSNHWENYRSRVARFVDTNSDYYLRQFSRFGNPKHPKFTITWHWPALFSFFFWALYRRLWGWALVHFAGSLLLMINIVSPLVSLIWLLVWPLTANFIYFKHVTARIGSLATEADEQLILTKGGVSSRSVWVGALVTFAIFVFASNYIAVRLLEKYEDEVSDVLPGSGSQTRGDGSIVTDTGEKDSDLSKTSLSLSFLATSLKLLVISDDMEKNRQRIQRFVERISKNSINDSWGTDIQVVAYPDSYTIISAGPDRTFSTDDDILQKVNIEIPIN